MVAEYHTASGMATDVPDIVDAMYHNVAEYMHAGDLLVRFAMPAKYLVRFAMPALFKLFALQMTITRLQAVCR